MASVPTSSLTLCEVNYEFDDYGYEEVIPLRGTLSLTPRPSDGGVYRYDRDYEVSLISPDKPIPGPLSLPRTRGVSTAQSSYASFLNERYENYASGHYSSPDHASQSAIHINDLKNDRLYVHRHQAGYDEGQSLPSLSSKPRARTALPYFSDSSVSGYGSLRSRSQTDSRLKWVEPLETWVEDETQNPVPYLSFVQNVALTSRGPKAEVDVIEHDVSVHPCGRFLAHMHMKNVSLGPVRKKKTVKAKKPTSQRNEVSDPHKDRPRVRVSYPPWPPKRSKAKKVVVPSASDSSASRQPAPPPPSPPKTPTPEPPRVPSREPSPDPDEDMGYRSGDQEEDADKFDAALFDLGPYVSTERQDDNVVQKMRSVTVKEKPEVSYSQCEPPKDEILEAQQLPTVKLDDAKKLGLSVKKDPEGEVKKPKKARPPVVKKTKVVKAKIVPVETPPKSVTPPQFESRKKVSWIFDDEDFSSEGENDDDKVFDKMEDVPEEPKTPTPPPKTPTPPPQKTPSPQQLEDEDDEAYKKRWGPRVKDTSLEDERERQRIAEERRRKAALLFEKLRGKKYKDGDDDDDDDDINFDEYDFLAKYCIFNKGNLEMYKKTFDVVDEDDDGMLDFEETLMGLKGINRGLSDAEQEYIYRVLEHVGYKVTDGADLKLFSVICALSQKIGSLDSWMRNLIGRIDFKMLDMKMFMCKTLWECNVDPETNKIPIDQLCVELRAGGVSLQHERQVREKLQHLHALDILDFLTYIPLFLMIHTSVVDNPLDDTRDK